MRYLLYVRVSLLAIIPFHAVGAEDSGDKVYRFGNNGQIKNYQIDKSVLFERGKTLGKHLNKLDASSQDIKSYKAQIRSQSRKAGKPAGMVFYPEGKEKKESLRRILYNQMVLTLDQGADPAGLSAQLGAKEFEVTQGVNHKLLLLTFEDAVEVLEKLESCRKAKNVKSAEPLLAQKYRKMAVPTDPRFAYSQTNAFYQWHLSNTGQNTGIAGEDVNILEAWDSYQGEGITIAISDDGLEIRHPDLAPNARTFPHYNWQNNTGDPTPGYGSYDSHGTSVGGVAAARWNNEEGGSGSAPLATLVGLRWLTDDDAFMMTGSDVGQTLAWGATWGLEFGATPIDVHNNSWGPGHPTFFYEWSKYEEAGLMDGIKLGRDGLGTIYMFAAGNDGLDNGNVNHSYTSNSIYTVAIGAINDIGVKSSYSTPGCALVVSAPSNDFGEHQGITTTKLTSYGSPYTDAFGGTSSATPLTSGIVALMLEANPNLGWRDVQEILITSAEKNDEYDIDWQTNGAGFHFNHQYGAGRVDATAAVNLAKIWNNLDVQASIEVVEDELSIEIPDGQNYVELEFDLLDEDNLRIEHTQLELDIVHPNRADLQIVVISPDGTESRMLESFLDPDNEANLSFFKLMSTFNWGENSSGIWTVRIYDVRGGSAGILNYAALSFHGVDTPLDMPPVVTSSDHVGSVVNTPLSYTLTERNADTITLVGTLPPGLFYDEATQTISGIPTELGTTQVVFYLTNEFGVTEFVLTIFIAVPASDTLAGAIEQEGEVVNTSGQGGIWDIELIDTADGSDAISSPDSLENSSWADVNMRYNEGNEEHIVMFNWKVSSQDGSDRLWFYPAGTGLQWWSGFISGDKHWGTFATKLFKGKRTMSWRYTKDSLGAHGEDRGFVDQVQVIPAVDYAAMLTDYSGSNLEFSTDSIALWTPEDIITSPDLKALRASAIGNGQYSDLTAVVVGPGRLTFRWQVSCERRDRLQFYVAGVISSTITGEVPWVEEEIVIPSGEQRLTWRYIKDVKFSGGRDTAFIDTIAYVQTVDYAMWAANHFSEAQLADPEISGVDADPNSNGISNLLEYAFGGNPLEIDGVLDLPSLVMDDNGRGFIYRKNTMLTDLNYIMEESTDLVTWTPVTPDLVDTVGEIETYRYALTPSEGDPERFLRVQVVK